MEEQSEELIEEQSRVLKEEQSQSLRGLCMYLRKCGVELREKSGEAGARKRVVLIQIYQYLMRWSSPYAVTHTSKASEYWSKRNLCVMRGVTSTTLLAIMLMAVGYVLLYRNTPKWNGVKTGMPCISTWKCIHTSSQKSKWSMHKVKMYAHQLTKSNSAEQKTCPLWFSIKRLRSKEIHTHNALHGGHFYASISLTRACCTHRGCRLHARWPPESETRCLACPCQRTPLHHRSLCTVAGMMMSAGSVSCRTIRGINLVWFEHGDECQFSAVAKQYT